jgi:uncharacterized protein
VGGKLREPSLQAILRFCEQDPVERVFLEDVARRRLGKFVGLEEDGELVAICHLGTNVVPSGVGCAAFAHEAARSQVRMLIGESRAVSDLFAAGRDRLPRVREDRPGQPVFALRAPPPAAGTGLRATTLADLELILPACAAAHEEELGVDPLRVDPDGFRWWRRAAIEEGRSWLWEDDGVILFKAEASAWTPSAVQLQRVWVDPVARRQGYARRGMLDLCRLLLERVPTVCLFVRTDNEPAIRLYEAIGMRQVLSYRSILF